MFKDGMSYGENNAEKGFREFLVGGFNFKECSQGNLS